MIPPLFDNPETVWVTTPWEDYLAQPAQAHAKRYYHQGRMQIQPEESGAAHGGDIVLIVSLLSLYAVTRQIPLSGRTACLHRRSQQPGSRLDCQPDIAYYIGPNAGLIPNATDVIDLDRLPPPDLVIEVGHYSLADDQGPKRLLYEDLNVREYWIVDVLESRVMGFAIANHGSHRITESQVLPTLPLTLIERALALSRQRIQSEVIAWIYKQLR